MNAETMLDHSAYRQQDVSFDASLIRRYDVRGPRYTSYPTALQFEPGFPAEKYAEQCSAGNAKSRPLSLYVHIPFCESLCYYCGCNKVVTRNKERVSRYLQHLHREIEMQATLFHPDRRVGQLHFGGGTPTYLSDDQLRDLLSRIRRCFPFEASRRREFSIEIDPRTISTDTVSFLANIGFNRLSIGIQDFDPAVQAAVNRRQSAGDVAAIVSQARDSGFRSISFDLIYGLPHQTVVSFNKTLNQVINLRPDRLAIYNYAHLPARFKGQRMIRKCDLPGPTEKLEILRHTIDRLQAASYIYIGMDHFARNTDELALAQQNGTLHRNFQGYSTRGDCDLIGLGASAIGRVGNSFVQNATHTRHYEELIGSGKLAVVKGLEVDKDDRLREQVIQALMCQYSLDISQFENFHEFDFNTYFRPELLRLHRLQEDGLVELDSCHIRITAKGRLLLRNIAMVFDRYLAASEAEQQFSQAI